MTAPFGFVRPATLDHALEELGAAGAAGRVVAGGTDLMVALRHGGPAPSLVVDVTRVPELNALTVGDDDTLRLGAALTHSQVARSGTVRRFAPLLSQASASVGSVQVRNLGTLGGNAVNAAVAADTLPALAALRCHFEVAGPEGRRRLSVDEFFLGPNRTALGPGELLTAILVPRQPSHGACFLKVGRRLAAAISRLSVAVMANPDTGLARIALGAVFPLPQRVTPAEEVLARGFTDEVLADAGHAAEAHVRRISGERPSMRYKLPVIRATVTKALRHAVRSAQEAQP